MEVNMAAAAEIARQLRLRDMGGIIVVDFIDMHKAQNRQLLHEHMTKLMANDRAKHTILPLSKFGLMQITRHRVRPEAISDVKDVCPTCYGTGKIEPTILLDRKIENQISYLAGDKGIKYIRLRVSPYVASFLKRGLLSLRLRWCLRYRCRIVITEDQSVGIVETRYLDRKGRNLVD